MKKDSPFVAANNEAQAVLSYLVHYPPPVSLDMLISLTGLSALSVLRVIERFKERKVVTEKPSHGKGLYFLSNPAFLYLERKKLSAEDTKAVLTKIIDLYTNTSVNPDEKILALADLYMRLGETPPEGFACIDKAAGIQLNRGNKENAAQLYDFLCRLFLRGCIPREHIEIFVNSIIQKVTLTGQRIPIENRLPCCERHDRRQ
jgi:hypothetical protein